MAQTLVLGLVYGGIYGLLAVGVVLVYRGSRVLNFAQGEIGTASLFVAWWLTTERGLPWFAGAAGAVAAAAAVGLLFERLIVRRMAEAGRLAVAVASVGLLLFLLSVEFKFNGVTPREIAPPIAGRGPEIAGFTVTPTEILALVVTAVAGLALAAFLKRTDFGLGVLAASEDPVAVRLVGVPAARVSAFTWGLGAALSAVAALLILPSIGVFAPGFMSEVFVKALAAALVGGLVSLPGAFVGGLVVGVVETQVGRAFLDSELPGIPTVAVFALILLVLLLRPQGLLGRTA